MVDGRKMVSAARVVFLQPPPEHDRFDTRDLIELARSVKFLSLLNMAYPNFRNEICKKTKKQSQIESMPPSL